jgi:glutathione S-transferase
MYRLISATPSPYARKVRIALLEKGVPFELVTEVPWNADTATPRYNPLEKVPVLIAPNGESVFESRYVLEWIEVKHPDPPLAPTKPDDLLAMKRYEVIADGACDALVLLFIERSRTHPSAEWTARQKRKADGALRELSRTIAGRSFCVADRLTYADLAVVSLLGWMRVRMPDYGWESLYPDLVAYTDRLEARPSFQSTVPTAQVIRDKVA